MQGTSMLEDGVNHASMVQLPLSCLTLLLCGTTQQTRPVGGKAGCMGSGAIVTARSEACPGNSLPKSSEPTSTWSKKRELGPLSSTMSTETCVVIGGQW